MEASDIEARASKPKGVRAREHRGSGHRCTVVRNGTMSEIPVEDRTWLANRATENANKESVGGSAVI